MQENWKHFKGPISILAMIIAVILILAGKELPDVFQAKEETSPLHVDESFQETEKLQETVQISETAQTVADTQKADTKKETYESVAIAESQAEETTTEETTTEETTEEKSAKETTATKQQETTYKFRSKKLLNQHYEKHGIEMGFDSAAAYEEAASAVINNPDALYKTEKEDGDGVYYVEATNEFVILSTDGYIRTYFNPSGGISYFNRQ